MNKDDTGSQFPMRINKYLALKGYATRRGADVLIEQGLVTINGKTAKLGDTVRAADEVSVSKHTPHKDYVYFAYNKPIGVLTHSAQKGEKDIASLLKRKDVFPIGRLDKNSHGLIILTNDGRLTDRLLNPKYDHEKEYEVEVDRPLAPRDIKRLETGIVIEGYKTKPTKVKCLDDKKISITLTEGKKHQIRRMIAALGPAVRDLKRIRIMNLKIGALRDGQLHQIKDSELVTFLSKLRLTEET